MNPLDTIRRLLCGWPTAAERNRRDLRAVRQQLASIQEELQGHATRLVAVQNALLPKDLPSLPGFEATVSYQPRQVVGGDCYGVVPFAYPGQSAVRHIAVAIGDVCGHDVAATVVMAIVLAILRSYRDIPAGPADVWRHLNARLCEMCLPDSLTTGFLGFLSLEDYTLTYSIAGHPPPLVRHPDGTVERLDRAASVPLGILEDARWEDAEATLSPGSLLCLYTDGVTETTTPGGGMYGLTALTRALATASAGSRAAVDHIVADVAKHQGNAPQADDRTLMVIHLGDRGDLQPADDSPPKSASGRSGIGPKESQA